MDMEEETRHELAALQREKELLQTKEKDNLIAINEVDESFFFFSFSNTAPA